MKNERTANELMVDYNSREWEQRKAWAKVLAKPAVKREVKPVQKVGFFSKLFQGV